MRCPVRRIMHYSIASQIHVRSGDTGEENGRWGCFVERSRNLHLEYACENNTLRGFELMDYFR